MWPISNMHWNLGNHSLKNMKFGHIFLSSTFLGLSETLESTVLIGDWLTVGRPMTAIFSFLSPNVDSSPVKGLARPRDHHRRSPRKTPLNFFNSTTFLWKREPSIPTSLSTPKMCCSKKCYPHFMFFEKWFSTFQCMFDTGNILEKLKAFVKAEFFRFENFNGLQRRVVCDWF